MVVGRAGLSALAPAVRPLLHDPSPYVRASAIFALAAQIIGSLGDRDSIDRLIYLSAYRGQQGTQAPAEVMLAVAGALSQLGVGGGTAFADEYASSPNEALRAQAAFVYGQVGPADGRSGRVDADFGRDGDAAHPRPQRTGARAIDPVFAESS